MAMSLSSRNATGAEDNLLTKATNALKAWQRNGHAVNPDNPAHVQTYINMCNAHRRPTAEKVVGYINSAEETLTTGETHEFPIWCVQKANFPSGLPPDMVDSQIDPDRLGNKDQINFYYLDQVIERGRLGKGVVVTKIFSQVNSTGLFKGVHKH